jgi:fatty-acyl-CoA synthase/long-chain acyl-CoA synthetase
MREDLTFQALLKTSLKKHSRRILAKFGEREFTYKDIDLASNRVANAIKEAGFGPGDRMATMLPNSFELLTIAFGIYKSGATYSPLNMMVGDNDIAYIISDAQIKVIFVDASLKERISKLESSMGSVKKIVVVNMPEEKENVRFEDFIKGKSDGDPAKNVSADSECLIVYTGGTTGRPKGVVHTQYTLALNILAHTALGYIGPDDVFLLMTPLSHSAGWQLYSGACTGAKYIIESQFDPFKLMELVQKEKVTKLFLVPTIIYVMLDILKQQKYDLSSLKSLFYGASPIQANRLEEALEAFGPILIQKYGLVECPNMITALSVADHLEAKKNPELLKSCGKADIMVTVKIVDDQDNELPIGELGEIIVSSPYLMKEYLNQPDVTAETLKGGWLHTGDMGRMDKDGYVYIMDRKKDMIISGGMNVYPAEIEAVISQHPKVKQVSVIGVPDDKWGEIVMAVVVPEGAVEEGEIKEYCRGKLAKFAQPKKVVIQNGLPLTIIGKVDKKALRAPYWQNADRGVH